MKKYFVLIVSSITLTALGMDPDESRKRRSEDSSTPNAYEPAQKRNHVSESSTTSSASDTAQTNPSVNQEQSSSSSVLTTILQLVQSFPEQFNRLDTKVASMSNRLGSLETTVAAIKKSLHNTPQASRIPSSTPLQQQAIQLHHSPSFPVPSTTQSHATTPSTSSLLSPTPQPQHSVLSQMTAMSGPSTSTPSSQNSQSFTSHFPPIASQLTPVIMSEESLLDCEIYNRTALMPLTSAQIHALAKSSDEELFEGVYHFQNVTRGPADRAISCLLLLLKRPTSAYKAQGKIFEIIKNSPCTINSHLFQIFHVLQQQIKDPTFNISQHIFARIYESHIRKPFDAFSIATFNRYLSTHNKSIPAIVYMCYLLLDCQSVEYSLADKKLWIDVAEEYYKKYVDSIPSGKIDLSIFKIVPLAGLNNLQEIANHLQQKLQTCRNQLMSQNSTPNIPVSTDQTISSHRSDFSAPSTMQSQASTQSTSSSSSRASSTIPEPQSTALVPATATSSSHTTAPASQRELPIYISPLLKAIDQSLTDATQQTTLPVSTASNSRSSGALSHYFSMPIPSFLKLYNSNSKAQFDETELQELYGLSDESLSQRVDHWISERNFDRAMVCLLLLHCCPNEVYRNIAANRIGTLIFTQSVTITANLLPRLQLIKTIENKPITENPDFVGMLLGRIYEGHVDKPLLLSQLDILAAYLMNQVPPTEHSWMPASFAYMCALSLDTFKHIQSLGGTLSNKTTCLAYAEQNYKKYWENISTLKSKIFRSIPIEGTIDQHKIAALLLDRIKLYRNHESTADMPALLENSTSSTKTEPQ